MKNFKKYKKNEYKRMSGITLKFNTIRLNKKEFYKSKHPIELNSVSVG